MGIEVTTPIPASRIVAKAIVRADYQWNWAIRDHDWTRLAKVNELFVAA
jgi:hypothetical protein